MPTVLQYGQLKAPATLELIKQLTRCSFSYPTPKQFYTDPTLALPFSSIKLPRKKTAAKLRQQRKSYTEAELRERREYMALYFRPAPQAAVRSFCKFKAGTPPLSAFGHRVELKSRPLDLDQRMEDLSDNAGLPLPDRKRNAEPAADPDFVFLAVLPGGQPAGIALEISTWWPWTVRTTTTRCTTRWQASGWSRMPSLPLCHLLSNIGLPSSAISTHGRRI